MNEEPALLTGPAPAAQGSLLAWLAMMAALTVVAILAGALVGWYLAGTVQQRIGTAPAVTAKVEPHYPADTELRALVPIITNLADPPEVWVRLQVAIAFDRSTTQKPEVLAAQISEDILGYVRTLSLAKIGGASGLQHLREDLSERARIRSDGQVRELVIQTLVVQ